MLKYFRPIACTKISKYVKKGSPAKSESVRHVRGIKRKLDTNDMNDRISTCRPTWSRDDKCSSEQNEFLQPAKKLKKEKCPPFFGIPFRKLSAEKLDCDYLQLYAKRKANELFDACERELEYFTGDLTRVQVYGKWHSIPRKQVAHGDSGLTYKYSGVTVPAKPWTPLLQRIRDRIEEVTGQRFNFVLINRYKDGTDYMGEHRDDEKELVQTSPIASLSLGQQRDFVFRHGDSRGKNAKRNLPPIRLELENGSLLVMNYPTNVYWYHSLPVRKKVVGIRINMTFRCLKT
ncbi:DNA oxidative demethylase ALKBH2-like [Acanthaster planci]|uniref:DNA oxidative demethylase ALKBH2 n=1 Tax=Acanthaster planci TaxID=133434 RepID=A0A8B7ZZJ5_ACAPL|nr:DNA oxidative demethylase ALKBH2-like [Acanthaster planci]